MDNTEEVVEIKWVGHYALTGGSSIIVPKTRSSQRQTCETFLDASLLMERIAITIKEFNEEKEKLQMERGME